MPTTDTSRLGLAALAVAKTQIGVTEKPPGSNRGPEVDVYIKSTGLNPVGNSYAWCACFVYWAFKIGAQNIGTINPLVRTGGVMDHWRRAKPERKITKAQALANPQLIRPGMICIWLIAPLTGAGHTGIVESIAGNNLVTVEGNSNELGSRDALSVTRQTKRKLTDKILVGFLDYSK